MKFTENYFRLVRSYVALSTFSEKKSFFPDLEGQCKLTKILRLNTGVEFKRKNKNVIRKTEN